MCWCPPLHPASPSVTPPSSPSPHHSPFLPCISVELNTKIVLYIWNATFVICSSNVGLLCSWCTGIFFFGGGSSLKSGNRIIPCVYTCSQMFSMCLHAEYIVIYSFCLVDGAFLQPVQCENHGRRQSPACFLHISRIHSRFSILNVNGGQLFKMY